MPLDQPESYELLPRSSSDSGHSPTVGAGRAVPKSLPARSLILWIFTAIHIIPKNSKRPFGSSNRRIHAYPYGGRPRSITRIILRSIAAVVGFLFSLSLLRAILFSSYQHPPAHYNLLRDDVAASALPGRGNPYNEKIFIAANILQEDLIRGVWGEAVLELVDLLGEENVFVSIYENDSGLGTADALKELRNKLRCKSHAMSYLWVGLVLMWWSRRTLYRHWWPSSSRQFPYRNSSFGREACQTDCLSLRSAQSSAPASRPQL